ncbi:MAG: hypothetical protein HY816_15065 [Candidatus Wallbacteria bacterium]|nr:hypothetical protein [Candidatus Wallbacteria bacterium]
MKTSLMTRPVHWMAIALCLAFAGPAGAEPSMVDLQVADVLCRPGDDVVMRAKLEENGIRGEDIDNVAVEFRLDGKVLGSSKTNDDGVAVFRLRAPAAGDHVVKAVFEGTAEYMRGEYNALLCVRPSTTPLMILDIDWTISMTQNLNTAFGSSDSPPLKDAAEVVRTLAAKYLPVYVTARARQLRKRTISWLDRYAFPKGPVYVLNPKEFPTYNEAKYKKSVLLPMKDLFPKIVAGFGNKESDVEAYKAAGIPSVLITERSVPDATCVPAWSAVEQALGGK